MQDREDDGDVALFALDRADTDACPRRSWFSTA
jgi:hypothetical protein